MKQLIQRIESIFSESMDIHQGARCSPSGDIHEFFEFEPGFCAKTILAHVQEESES